MRPRIIAVSAALLAFARALPARAQQIEAKGEWSGRVEYVSIFDEQNPGRMSAKAPSSDRSDAGGLEGKGHYGWYYNTEDWKHGAGGVYLEGFARAHGSPGLSFFSPSLSATWWGSFHRHGTQLPFGYDVVVDLRHDSYSMHLRDGWTRYGYASLNWSAHGGTRTDWRGFADYPFFEVAVGAEAQRHDSTAVHADQRAVFDGTWDGAWLRLTGHVVATQSMSPWRLLKRVQLLTTIRDGDLVVTGPATPDVVAAARAVTPDRSLGDKTPPYDAYRLHARTLILDGSIRVATHVSIGWAHEMDSARAGYKATSDFFYLRLF